jgi:hypothetical protein
MKGRLLPFKIHKRKGFSGKTKVSSLYLTGLENP